MSSAIKARRRVEFAHPEPGGYYAFLTCKHFELVRSKSKVEPKTATCTRCSNVAAARLVLERSRKTSKPLPYRTVPFLPGLREYRIGSLWLSVGEVCDLGLADRMDPWDRERHEANLRLQAAMLANPDAIGLIAGDM